MTNQDNSAFPVVKPQSSLHAPASKHDVKSLVLALCLSMIPAIAIGAIGYQWLTQDTSKPISQTHSGETTISPILQREQLLQLLLFVGVASVLSGAIAVLLSHRLNLRSSTSQYSKKALLFGDIASQSQPVDLNYLYNRAVEGAREILHTGRVMVYTFDADWNGTIVAESVAPKLNKSLGHQITDTCIKESKGGLYKNGRICVIDDITKAGLAECHLKLLAKYQVKANMVVPILKDDQLLGLLIAHQCDTPRVWQHDEIDFFVQLATIMALRLSRVNFLAHREQAGQERSVSQVALRLRQSLEPETLLNTAASEIQQALHVDRVLIYQLNSSQPQDLVVAESVIQGWPKMLGLPLPMLGVTESHLNRFKNGYAHAQPINISEPSASNTTHMTLTQQYKVKAGLVAPIRISNQLVGLIIAHQCSTIRTWEPLTIELFEELAVQVGLALEQATFLTSMVAEAKRTQVLATFTSQIRQSLNSDDIFCTSVEDIRKVLETDRVLIYRLNSDSNNGTITAQAVAPEVLPAQEQTLDQLFQEESFQGYKTGSLWVTHDINDAHLSPTHAKVLKRLCIKAKIIAPILSSDSLVGLLCVHQCSGRRNWQQSEFYFLKQLATQIGFAIDQAQLIEQVNMVSLQQRQQAESLQRQLMSLINDVERAASGDLTVRADVTEGEIGTVADFFNAVIESLRQVVTQVKLATVQVNTSLGENEGAIRQLVDIAHKQAQETTQTLNSVEQMTRSIQEVALGAHHAAAVARTASETAEAGTEAIAHTVQKITNLQETVVTAAKKVRRLGETSQEISQVVSLINQIALQTNLLAINAGIEASRTGEDDQGFAVVAEEVSELAVRSAAATKQIEQIVATMQLETSQAVEAMEQGTSQVIEGTRLVEDTKQNLSCILDVSRQMDSLVQSISRATSSQVETSNVVTELIKQMAIVSEQTSKSAEQISHSLQETVTVAQHLQASVEVVNVDDDLA